MMRKKYILKKNGYKIIATQLSCYSENYTLTVKDLKSKSKKPTEWIRPKTSPFFDGIKKCECFYVQAPIEEIIPLSKFELIKFE